MGFFGKDEDKGSVTTPVGSEDQGWSQKLSGDLAQKLIDFGIAGAGPMAPAAESARKALDEAGSVDAAIERVVRKTVRGAEVGGFVTGLGGFVTLPVALPANVLEFYILATRMTAQIAHLRGHDLSRADVRSAVLLTLVGTESADILTKVGTAGTGRVASFATRGLSESALMVVNKAVAFRLVSKLGTKALSKLGKFVPVVGGVIGAGLDSMLMRRIAKNAEAQFPQVAQPLSA